MTDQGSGETPTSNVPTPPVPPAPIYQQPAAYQPPAFQPPPAPYPPQPPYQQPAPPNWGQPQQPPPGGPAWGQPQQQPPAAGGPGWGQPQQAPPQQYWGNPNAMAESGAKGTSILAVIAGIPLLVYGLLIMLAGAALIVIKSFVDNVITQGGFDASLAQSVKDAITVVAVIILIVGILHVLAAIGIWAHKGWGRWLAIIWGVLGTLIGLASLGARGSTTINGTTTSGGGAFGALFILVPYGFVLIAMIIGGAQFRRRRG